MFQSVATLCKPIYTVQLRFVGNFAAYFREMIGIDFGKLFRSEFNEVKNQELE